MHASIARRLGPFLNFIAMSRGCRLWCVRSIRAFCSSSHLESWSVALSTRWLSCDKTGSLGRKECTWTVNQALGAMYDQGQIPPRIPSIDLWRVSVFLDLQRIVQVRVWRGICWRRSGDRWEAACRPRTTKVGRGAPWAGKRRCSEAKKPSRW